MGLLALAWKRPADAEKLFRTAVKLHPESYAARLSLGQLLVDAGRESEAIAHLVRARELKPRSAGPHSLLGLAAEKQGEIDAACGHYEAALALKPDNVLASNNLAVLLTEKGVRLDYAIRLAKGNVARQPRDPRLLDTLAWAYVKGGRAEKAVPLLEAAVRAMSQEPILHYHLGVAYAAAGQSGPSRKRLQTALSRSPRAAWASDARRLLAR